MAKKKKWIQKAFRSVRARGTSGKCTGSKFGSSSCPPGSKAYNMAKNLRALARKRKKEQGGYVDDFEYNLGGALQALGSGLGDVASKENPNVGDALQSLLPALDAVVPGLGTAASTVTGILNPLLREEPGKPIPESDNPFTSRYGSTIPKMQHGSEIDTRLANFYNRLTEKEILPKGMTQQQFSDLSLEDINKYRDKYMQTIGALTPEEQAKKFPKAKTVSVTNFNLGLEQETPPDTISFDDAFQMARNQGLKSFEFDGKKYSTELSPTAPGSSGRTTTVPGSKVTETISMEELAKRKGYRKGGSLKEIRKKPGGSNVGKARKTSGAKEGPFVGPSGGAPKGSYPVTNKKQWRAAKAYARHAPNPSGIKKAADAIARKRGWLKLLGGDMDYKYGGSFKQYNAPMHEHGGQTIDINGNPTNNPNKIAAEIEGRENALFDPSNKVAPYVFSEMLGTAQKAEKIAKMKGEDSISRKGRKVAFTRLKQENEGKRQFIDHLRYGGKYQTGGPFSLLGTVMKPAFNKYIAQSMEANPTADQSLQDQIISTAYKMDTQRVPFDAPATDPFTNTDQEVQLGTSPMSDVPVMEQLPSLNLPAGVYQGAYATPQLARRNIQAVPQEQQISPFTDSKPDPTPEVPVTTDDQGRQRIDIGSILKGAAYAGRALDVLQKPEIERLQLPDFSRGDELVTGTGTGFQSAANQALGAANIARETARASSRNLGQFMGRQRAISGSLGRNLADIKMKESQYRDQLALQRAGREDRKATQIAGERIRQQIATTQNKARRQDLIQNFMSDINNLGTEIQRQKMLKQITSDMNKNRKRQFFLDLMATNMTTPNFQIVNPSAFMKAVDEGNYDTAEQLIKFKG